MRQTIKAHLVNRSNRPVYRSKQVTHGILNLDLNSNQSNRPVNRSNRPVYRYEPVELSFLNSNLNSTGTDRFLAKPDRYTGIGPRRFGRTVGKVNPADSAMNMPRSLLMEMLLEVRRRRLRACAALRSELAWKTGARAQRH